MAETPRYALVLWPDNTLGAVPLEQVEEDVKRRGAIVICREDEWCCPETPIDPAQSNPIRKETDDDGG